MLYRNLVLLISILLFTVKGNAQPVTETIFFDNYVSPSDNDLTHNFYGTQSLYMTPSNGITGGCLVSPDSNNWGNDISRYCSRYDISSTGTYKTTISFLYDQNLVSHTGFDRAASIWLQPHADPNHYIIATVSHAGKIEIYTYYSFFNNPVAMPLQSGNWYNLELEITLPASPDPNTFSLGCKVTNLGPAGLSLPVTVDSLIETETDSVFASDDAVEISITASRYGGVSHLDNFTFNGVKSADSCLFTSVYQPEFLNDIKIISDNNSLILSGDVLRNKNIEIIDITGKKIFSEKLLSDKTFLDLTKFKSGIYFLLINNIPGISAFKFTVVQ